MSGGGAPDSFVTQVRKQSFKIEEGGPRSANGETSFTEASTSSSFENPCNSPTTHTQTDAHTRVHTYTHVHACKQVCLDGKEPREGRPKPGMRREDTALEHLNGYSWYKCHTVRYGNMNSKETQKLKTLFSAFFASFAAHYLTMS